jgi:tetratricopeptide (TPR) repeat protein
MAPRSSSRLYVAALVVALAPGLARAGAPATATAAPAPVSADSAPGTGAEGEKPTAAVALTSDPELEYRLGTQAYALGNYELAIVHFERSYELSNHPYLLYNLGMAYAQWHGLSPDLGHLRKARRLFQNYIKALADDASLDQEQRDEAEAQIARIDEQIAETEAKQKAAAPPVEGPQEPKTTGPQQPPVDQGPSDDRPVYRRGWFWAVIGVGVLAVAGGVTAGVLLSRRDDGKPAELGTIGPTSGQAPTGLGFRF